MTATIVAWAVVAVLVVAWVLFSRRMRRSSEALSTAASSRHSIIQWSPDGRVYSCLLDLQLYFQDVGDEAAEDVVCEVLDLWGRTIDLRALEDDEVGQRIRRGEDRSR